MSAITVLLVEDEKPQRELVASLLEDANYHVVCADSVPAALDQLDKHAIDVVVSDHQLGAASGMDLLNEVRSTHSDVGFIMVTAYGSIANAVAAIRQGADDYLTKPFERQTLLMALQRTLKTRDLQAENARLQDALQQREKLVDIIGKAPSMQRVFRHIEKVAATDATVLIEGESGTGKELAARALHKLSTRDAAPFVAVNCGAIPENLIESEFFGSVKGAYTGADRDRVGKFEAANGGSLFLDEMGELPLAMQPKLLRALQEGCVTPVGSHTELKVDARIIAATNRGLRKAVDQGLFREDLYYRLSVVPIRLPALRERREDIPMLAEHFWAEANLRHDATAKLSRPLLRRFLDYPWPGNVRELSNVVERLVLLADGETAQESDLPDSFFRTEGAAVTATIPAQGMDWQAHEKAMLARALEMANDNRTQAAKLLSLPYKAFLYRLQKHGLE